MPSETTRVMGAGPTGSFEGVRTAAVDGSALAYREQGEGEAVVFVHGSASDLRTWEHQLPAIGTSYRAIAYSRRYARPNEDIEPGADDQMLPHVDDLAALLRLTGAAPAHLVGHSWGAFICLLAAIRHPEMVRSLVLQEPPVLSLFVSTPPLLRELFPLLVRRQRSPAFLLRLTEHLQRLLPNAERVDIAGASHAMQEENPGAVNEAILGFLARDASGRS